MRDVLSSQQVAFVSILILELLSPGNGFFMGTKHTTPPTQLPMHNHNGKTYAKVGDQYVEYNDDEMYYDKNDKMKNQEQLDNEAKEAIKADPIVSDEKTRKEEKFKAEQAWKQVKREDVDDVTGLPMYEGETYNQYGKVEYNETPQTYGGAPLGGKDIDEPHYGPPLNPYYGGPGGQPMEKDYEVPDVLTGGGGNQRFFANPFGAPKGFQGNPHNLQYMNEDYGNYVKDPPKGIYTLNPLSEEKSSTTEGSTIPPLTRHFEPPPYGMMPNVSTDSFEKYHGPDGLLNNSPYGKNRRVIELNERRASYAMYMHNKQHSPDFDTWAPPTTKCPTRRTTTERTTTTEFIPRSDITIPNYICNF